VSYHQRRLLGLGDDVGHGERLAAASDPEQRLIAVAAGNAVTSESTACG